MPPCPTSTRISYCPMVARRSAASWASDASGRGSTAPDGVATVGPDHGRCTGMPVPQRGQNGAPGPRVAPQRKQASGGFGVIPATQDTAIITLNTAKTPYDQGPRSTVFSWAPRLYAVRSAARERQFQSAHHVERPLRCNGQLGLPEHHVAKVFIIPREARPQRRHCARFVRHDELTVQLLRLAVPIGLVRRTALLERGFLRIHAVLDERALGPVHDPCRPN